MTKKKGKKAKSAAKKKTHKKKGPTPAEIKEAKAAAQKLFSKLNKMA